ncbi:MAG: hypothetical protein GEU28_07540 [Dehalococcoidia bacterium]|nr:hypothetical protein [Dehalococcoidia bacterium]
MNAKPTDIDGYLSAVPDDARATLEKLRRTIKAVAPGAVESVSYGVPTFKYQGRPLIYIGAAKNHCAIYGMNVGAYQDELAAYDTAKGTIRFPPNEPPPKALVKKLVSDRLAEIDAAATGRKRKKPDPGTPVRRRPPGEGESVRATRAEGGMDAGAST